MNRIMSLHAPSAPAPYRQELSRQARDELLALVRAASTRAELARSCAQDALPHLRAELERCRQEVDSGRRFVVLDLRTPEMSEGPPWYQAGMAVIAHLLGRVLPQDADGTLAISVWDRDPTRTMADGARYHQTHEGGSIHTDNVNQPDIWDYLIFGCIAGARAGGETILVDARQLHAHLEEHFPDVLATLRGDFVWEYRGIKDAVYTAPAVSYDQRGTCQFRYLRPYVEAAHEKTGKPLTREQVYAFDVLDALLEESVRQIRFTLRPGQVLIARDCQILHGRTGFVDHPDAVPVHQARAGDVVKRTMERYWVQRVESPGTASDLTDRYQRARLLLSEEMYGAGFQSSGGERFLDMTTPHMQLRPDDRVLDLGCGTGGTLRYLANRYGIHGTGVDGAADCIALARETAVSGLDFIHSDFRDLELTGRYHAMWTCQSLLYISEKVASLQRVLPHLVPGRNSLLADYCRGEGSLSPAFLAYCADCGFELPTIRGFSETVTEAGFRVLDTVDYTDWFIRAMESEVAHLEANKADFLSRYQESDFEHLRTRWNQKIDFCRRGDMRVAYVVAQVPNP